MVNVTLQITDTGLLAPFSVKDEEEIRVFKPYQPIISDLRGTTKPRSVKQMKAYWRMCRIVSDNYNKPEYATYKHVDWRLRNALQFYDTDFIFVNGSTVSFKVRSISFKNLKHIDACNYFDRAFELVCKSTKIPMSELVKEE